VPPEYFTPPELAKLWRVSPEKIIAFIRGEELAAFDAARKGASRPRWRITPDAVRAFEHGRQATPRPELPPRRQRRTEVHLKRFI
jgi:hypothetical protein